MAADSPMIRKGRRTTARGLDRLVNFTDAAVAIAITFLVLPLVDVTSELTERSLGELLSENLGTLFAFFVTFAVIGRLWMVHTRVFEWVADYDPALIWLDFLWLLGIVCLPFAANLLSYADHEEAVYALYVGIMLVASGSTLAMEVRLLRRPGLMRPDTPAAAAIAPSFATGLILLAVLVLVVAVPSVNMWWLLLLFVSGPLESLLARLLHRPAPTRKPFPHSERGLDRLVNFSDATVAIAITIMVLPLVELAPGIAKPGADLSGLIAENSGTFLAFGLSFAIIAVFWVPHHRVFEHVGDYDGALVWANLAWLCGIAFFPFSTSVVAQTGDTRATVLLYIGTMIVISGSLALIDLLLIRRPGLGRADAEPVLLRLALTPLCLLVLALVLALLLPDVGLWWLLLLTLERPVLEAIRGFRTRRSGAAHRPRPGSTVGRGGPT